MPEKTTIYLTHLYPKEMAIYGDIGNIIALKFKLEEMGFPVVVQNVNSSDDALPTQNDFLFIGGGADKNQIKISEHLLKFKTTFEDLIMNQNIPLLAICGGYQLFGHEFITGSGETLKGLDILPITTKAPTDSVKDRCIGNVVIDCPFLNQKLVGFENHSGQTVGINSNFSPLGKTISGNGNNKKDGHEGCVLNNAIGTYMHGPCLTKNPELVDWFITKILKNKGYFQAQIHELLKKCDNTLENQVNENLVSRFS